MKMGLVTLLMMSAMLVAGIQGYPAGLLQVERGLLDEQLKQLDTAMITDQITGIIKEEFKTQLGIDVNFSLDDVKAALAIIGARIEEEVDIDMDQVKAYLAANMPSLLKRDNFDNVLKQASMEVIAAQITGIVKDVFKTQLGIDVNFSLDDLKATYATIAERIEQEVDIDMDQVKAYLAANMPSLSNRDNLDNVMKQASMEVIAAQITGIIKEEFKTQLGIDVNFSLDDLKAALATIGAGIEEEVDIDMDQVKAYLAANMPSLSKREDLDNVLKQASMEVIAAQIKGIVKEVFKTQLGIDVNFSLDDLKATYATIGERIKQEVDIDMDQVKAYLAANMPSLSKKDNLDTVVRQASMAEIVAQITGIIKEEFKTQLGIDVNFSLDDLKAALATIGARIEEEVDIDMDQVKAYLAANMPSLSKKDNLDTVVRQASMEEIAAQITGIIKEEFKTQLGIDVNFSFEDLKAALATIGARIEDKVDIDIDQVKAYLAANMPSLSKREDLDNVLKQASMEVIAAQITGIVKEVFKTQLGIDVNFSLDDLKATYATIGERIKQEVDIDMDQVKAYLAANIPSLSKKDNLDTVFRQASMEEIAAQITGIIKEEFKTQLGIDVNFSLDDLKAALATIGARIGEEVDIDLDQVKAYLAANMPSLSKREDLDNVLKQASMEVIAAQIKGIVKDVFKTQLGIDVNFTLDDLKATYATIGERIEQEVDIDMDQVKAYLAANLPSLS